MLVAGEPSGDTLGAQLMSALRALHGGDLEFSGVGGSAMSRQGLKSLFNFDQFALVGITQIIQRGPTLLKRIREITAYALAAAPDVIVLIDSNELSQRIAQRLKSRGFLHPIVKLVSPQIWGSRPNRIFKIAQAYDHILTLLPFEPAYYQKTSLPATYVGHLVTERSPRPGDGVKFRKIHNIPHDELLLAVLPGSRRSEIKLLLPLFMQTVELLAQTVSKFAVVVPTVPSVHDRVVEVLKTWPIHAVVVIAEEDKYAAFDASNIALAASGTVTLELAIARVPMVVGYKIDWLGAMIFRHLIMVRHITMANLILGQEIIPEFLQETCKPELMASALGKLIEDDTARNQQLAAFASVIDELTVEGEKPSVRAARAVLKIAGVDCAS